MKIYPLLGNSQMLDGGAMFGNAPKALWTRWCKTDDLNRIKLVCRCLLIEHEDHRILLETGIGNFFPPELKDRYGVQEDNHVLLTSLEERNVKPQDITHIILSHLHFDHAGGLLSQDQKSLIFPEAQIYTGKTQWERAINPHSRDRASYLPSLHKILESSQKLHLVQSKDDLPFSFLDLTFSDGHTPGLMLTRIKTKHFQIIFTADLIPGAPWVHAPITMGYDRFPEKLIDEKTELLNDCYENKHYLFFTHDPNHTIGQVSKNEKGKFSFLDGDTDALFGVDLIGC